MNISKRIYDKNPYVLLSEFMNNPKNGRLIDSLALLCGCFFIIAAAIAIFRPFEGSLDHPQAWSFITALTSLPVVLWIRGYYFRLNNGREESRIAELTNFTEDYLKRAGSAKKKSIAKPPFQSLKTPSDLLDSGRKVSLPRVMPVNASLEFRNRESTRI